MVLEFKPLNAPLSMGQRITLKQMVRKGFTVWMVWGDENIEVGVMDAAGDVKFVAGPLTPDELAARVARWFEQATRGEL